MANDDLQVQLTQPNNFDLILKYYGGDIDASKKLQKTLISIVINNPALAKCSAQSILQAAFDAMNFKLSLNPNLGYVYFLPFGDKAQFVIGYKGFIQLAIRSGNYRYLRAITLFSGMLKDYNFVTGQFEIGARTGDEVTGYLAYFKLKNGFEQSIYATKNQMQIFAEKHSKAYQNDLKTGKSTSPWSTDFNAMAEKTVLKQLISKYGYMSDDLEQALTYNNFYDFDSSDSEK